MQIEVTALAAIASAFSAIANIGIAVFLARSRSRIDGAKAEQTDAQTDKLYIENLNKLLSNYSDLSQEVIDLKRRFSDLEYEHTTLKNKLAQTESELITERELRQVAETKLAVRDAKIVELEDRICDLETKLGIRAVSSVKAEPVNG